MMNIIKNLKIKVNFIKVELRCLGLLAEELKQVNN